MAGVRGGGWWLVATGHLAPSPQSPSLPPILFHHFNQNIDSLYFEAETDCGFLKILKKKDFM